MYYLVYISTAIKLMTYDGLTDILTAARKRNIEDGITGLLLYHEGTFVQFLEGDEDAVEEAYSRINLDSRHKNLIKLIIGDADNRMFPDWSMGFATANKALFNRLEGFADPAKPGFLDDNEHSAAISILRTFAENNRIAG